jgi:hypothetical protein
MGAALLPPSPDLADVPNPSMDAPRPADMMWLETPTRDGSLEALHTPSRTKGVIFALAAIFWNGILIGLRHEIWLSSRAALVTMVPLGLILAYAALAELFSRTRVSLSRETFRCEASPFPLQRAVCEPTLDVRDCVASAGIHADSESGSVGVYAVYAEVSGGRMIRLPFHGLDADHASFVASRLNAKLESFRARPSAYRASGKNPLTHD